jgi:type III pantothenate kinase
MVLVDIGNTNIHVFEGSKLYNLKDVKKFNDTVYYISVNDEKEKEFLKLNPNAVNLEKKVNFDTSYVGLGIDRIMACKAVDDGIVVDAGSAVTIDVMHEGVHLGGVIMPGIEAFKEAFGRISKKLDLDFCEIDFNKIPQNTKEAISFGSIGAIVLMIERFKKNKKVYFTGGDGKFLSRYVDGIYVKDLVFRGMMKTIKELKD